MQLPYPNVRTPHLHPLPFRKRRGGKLRVSQNAEAVRHPSRAFEYGFLYASRFVEARPQMARQVTI